MTVSADKGPETGLLMQEFYFQAADEGGEACASCGNAMFPDGVVADAGSSGCSGCNSCG